MASSDAPSFSVGETVEVFYRMRRLRGSCLATSSLSGGLLSPRVGISDGWQEAVITRPPDDYNEYEVKYLHLFWFNRGGWRRSTCAVDMYDREHVAAWQIRRKAGGSIPAYPPPKLSLFVVRWGGCNGEEAEAFDGSAAGLWGHGGTSVCDKYINGVIDTFESSLGTDFEVTTAFVQVGSDLDALAGASPFIRNHLTGTHVAALYFLWPVAFQDKSGGAAGMVPEQSLFRAMQRIEMTGVPTRFPHPSHLYRNLVSKEWTAHLCLSPEYHIPATTKISMSAAVRDPFKAADAALRAIHFIKCHKRNEPVGDVLLSPWRSMRGVLKLGFSWEALDVLSFDGIDEMVQRLGCIAEQPGCLADYVFVQEYIDSDCEIRCYVLDDGTGLSTKPAHMRYTRPGHNDKETGRFRGFQDLTRQQAIDEWYGGNVEAVVKAEKEIEKLIGLWKLWLLTECSEIQPYMRFDFFVKRSFKNEPLNGEAESDELPAPSSGDLELGIYTGEMTELGGSTLNWFEGPSLIFQSILKACLEGEAVPPVNSYAVVRKYESSHIRFDDNHNDEEGSGHSDDDEDEDSDHHSYENGRQLCYESERQKYFDTFGPDSEVPFVVNVAVNGQNREGIIPHSSDDTDLKRPKLTP